MKRFLLNVVLLMCLFFSASSISCANQQEDSEAIKLQERSATYLKDAYYNKYDDFYKDFSLAMREEMTKEQLTDFMHTIFQKTGKLESILKTEYIVDDQYQFVIIQTKNSKKNLSFTFVYSKEGALEGFHYKVVENFLNEGTLIKPEEYSKDTLVKKSLEYLSEIHNGKIDVLYSGMDISLQDKITKETLITLWNNIAQQIGYFEQTEFVSKEEQGEYTRIAIIEKYSVKSLVVYMVYNEKQKMVGFFLQPVE